MTGILLALSLTICGCELAQEAGLSLDSSNPSPAVLAPMLAGERLAFYDPAPAEGELPSASTESTPPHPVSRADQDDDSKPVPWAIPESVFFVYRGSHNGLAAWEKQPVGTAFVLSVPDRRHRRFVRYLVTARHVVDPQWAHCAERNPSSIDLRLNRRSGGVGYETISLRSAGAQRFFTPSDSTADIAVMLLDKTLIPNIDDYKFLDVPFRLLPTDTEVEEFQADQPVMTARVVTSPPAGPGNFPVFDAGVLLKISGEAINVVCGPAPALQPSAKPLHVWLINAVASQGVSGAPVYAAIARGAETVKTPVLLGVQSVAWPNRGIAGITPSLVLGELIQTAVCQNRASLDFYKGPNASP